MRTSVAVVQSAYQTSLQGFALPYGDITVGSWRNTPYVVIQNVGAYLDIPRFLDSDHLINDAADAEAYLARLESYAAQLDGELGRIQAARELGLVPPAFLLDKAISQMTLSLDNARHGSVVSPSRGARQILPATGRLVPFPLVHRRLHPHSNGNWLSYRPSVNWPATIRASLPARMVKHFIDGPLRLRPRPRCHPKKSTSWVAMVRELHNPHGCHPQGHWLQQGSVGARMTRWRPTEIQFAEGDPGRAEIMAFIQQQLQWIKAQMPRAFNTLVDPYMEVKRLPPEEEPGAPGAYGGAGSLDGTIPGRYWINLHTTSLHSRYSLADLTFHEAIPGHIWQE
jgi:uncharacterized protein (DUF885 family)